jgi:hypothetical protein
MGQGLAYLNLRPVAGSSLQPSESVLMIILKIYDTALYLSIFKGADH